MEQEDAAPPLLSVVVPAHDEARVVGRCLDSLYAGFAPGELDVVVVANGCSDDTAAVAAAHPARPRVVELAVGSKIAALNAGDAVARGFPRAYVDADVRMCEGSLRRIRAALVDGPALVAAPRPHFAVAGRPWAVRAFYAAWQRLPFLVDAPVGNGVYVLSEAGRQRFRAFPDVIADDLFVLQLFAVDERAVPSGTCFVIETPRRLQYLLRVRRRVYTGNAQLAASVPGSSGDGPPGLRTLMSTVRRPRHVAELGVYVLVNLLARAQVRRARRHGCGPAARWERDDSTR